VGVGCAICGRVHDSRCAGWNGNRYGFTHGRGHVSLAGLMRLIWIAWIAVLLASSVPGVAQGTSAAAVLQRYRRSRRISSRRLRLCMNFSSPTLKPWHMKVSYQLYDEKGKPTTGELRVLVGEAGCYRSTWTREGWKRRSGTYLDNLSAGYRSKVWLFRTCLGE